MELNPALEIEIIPVSHEDSNAATASGRIDESDKRISRTVGNEWSFNFRSPVNVMLNRLFAQAQKILLKYPSGITPALTERQVKV